MQGRTDSPSRCYHPPVKDMAWWCELGQPAQCPSGTQFFPCVKAVQNNNYNNMKMIFCQHPVSAGMLGRLSLLMYAAEAAGGACCCRKAVTRAPRRKGACVTVCRLCSGDKDAGGGGGGAVPDGRDGLVERPKRDVSTPEPECRRWGKEVFTCMRTKGVTDYDRKTRARGTMDAGGGGWQRQKAHLTTKEDPGSRQDQSRTTDGAFHSGARNTTSYLSWTLKLETFSRC